MEALKANSLSTSEPCPSNVSLLEANNTSVGNNNENPAHVPQQDATPTPSVRKPTILVVEDQALIRVLTRRVLVKAGYHVMDVATGGDALAACEQYQGTIDLLLTDVVMPDLSGPDLVNLIHQTRPTLKVLYMSGYSSHILHRFDAKNTSIPLIQKPFKPADLTHQIGTLLSDKTPPSLQLV